MKRLIPVVILIAAILSSAGILSAQTRIAVLPFQNMDGKMEMNIWSYKLQDSLKKALNQLDPQSEHFYIVPTDSVELILADLNLDPTNPQYPSDMWKAVDMLGAEQVVTGNFNIRAGKFLINAYVYNVKIKLPHPHHQARDIFKAEDEIYESIPMMVESLKPALIE
jgi:TolB-like protein